MKRTTALLLCFAVIFYSFISLGASADSKADGDKPSVSALSAILYAPDSGTIIYEKDSHTRRPIASITKIMTALLAFEFAQSQDIDIKFTADMQAEGSSMYLKNGEIIKLSELAKGMMMVSGNDAANAIAITLGKSTDGFAEMMNQKAASLNMKDTHFVTPSGLDDEEHYSSAYDMAMLTAYSMENEQFKETVSQKSITVKYTSPENKTQICNNHNRLLSLYDGCIGVKTGFTKTAGRTLSSCVERNGVRLICVTLNDGDDWNDHQKLYDYGFSKMKTEILCQAKDAIQANVVGGEADEIQLYPSRDVNVSVFDGEQCKIESEIILPRFIYAPIRKGKAEGKIIFRVNGKIIGCADLIAKEECKEVIHEKGFFEKLFRR